MLAAMADRRPPPELSEVEEAEDDGIGMLAADHPAMARIQDALKKQLSEAYESKAQLYSERAAELAREKQRCARRDRARRFGPPRCHWHTDQHHRQHTRRPAASAMVIAARLIVGVLLLTGARTLAWSCTRLSSSWRSYR